MALDSRATVNASPTGDTALLDALLDQSALAIGVVDARGRLRITSRGLQDLIGDPPEGAPASSFPELFHLYNAAGTALLRPEEVPITRAAAGEMVRDVVISLRRPGRPVRHLRCNAAPLTSPDGERAGAIAMVEDVTAEQAAVSRQDMIRRLLLDTINHELRTPLTVVLANAELLIDVAPNLAEEVRGPLLAIVRSSEALRDTIQHVSDLVDLESFTHAERTEIDVATLLNVVSNRFWYRAEQCEVALQTECPPLLRWSLDMRLMVKALSALVDNALSHGPGHSKVRLSAETDGDVLRLSVTDEGLGIPPEDQERLIRPFERGLTTLDAHHSQGLGLALVHAVAACHHGAVSFTARPGRFTASMMLP